MIHGSRLAFPYNLATPSNLMLSWSVALCLCFALFATIPAAVGCHGRGWCRNQHRHSPDPGFPKPGSRGLHCGYILNRVSFFCGDVCDGALVFIVVRLPSSDSVYVGAPIFHLSFQYLGPVVIGEKTFLGNSAFVPSWSLIGSNSLVGVMSTCPRNPAVPLEQAAQTGLWNSVIGDAENWLGAAPAIKMPRRLEAVGKFSAAETFAPTSWLRTQRLVIEFFRIVLPTAAYITILVVFLADLSWLGEFTPNDTLSEWQLWMLWCAVYVGLGVSASFVVLLAKWLMIGRYDGSQSRFFRLFSTVSTALTVYSLVFLSAFVFASVGLPAVEQLRVAQ